ncbi:hypothetical protein ACFPJ1_20285 [Kribbella qitaiheensis]|uniref:hypothetical protein n=1 Tax=Kribbella qitaiheensis TaxID=1544730 RepID=UPI00361CBC97
MECSARFTGADGGQAGCFTFRAADQLVFEVVFQHQPDGTVLNLNVMVEGPRAWKPARL